MTTPSKATHTRVLIASARHMPFGGYVRMAAWVSRATQEIEGLEIASGKCVWDEAEYAEVLCGEGWTPGEIHGALSGLKEEILTFVSYL